LNQKLINQAKFLEKYQISQEKFEKTGLNWKDLEKIYSDYINFRPELDLVRIYESRIFEKIDRVHSIRSRLKDPEHLIEKIIRKKLKYPKREYTIENYKDKITDLIGFRLLHIFREEWIIIHKDLKKIKKQLREKIVAKLPMGDNDEMFKAEKIKVEHQKTRYRSVHYPLLSEHDGKRYSIEVQVRTLFEEAWGEVDHQLRYPYKQNDPKLNRELEILGDISGSADKLASEISNTIKELEEKNKQLVHFLKESEAHNDDPHEDDTDNNCQNRQLYSGKNNPFSASAVAMSNISNISAAYKAYNPARSIIDFNKYHSSMLGVQKQLQQLKQSGINAQDILKSASIISAGLGSTMPQILKNNGFPSASKSTARPIKPDKNKNNDN
jgi:ppGpp synthetase/RelA/SpoT-type nucleotidyltranferase